MGPLIPLFLDFLSCLPWISKPGWIPSLTFFVASDATPADLLETSMAAESFHPRACTCIQALVGLESRNLYLTA